MQINSYRRGYKQEKNSQGIGQPWKEIAKEQVSHGKRQPRNRLVMEKDSQGIGQSWKEKAKEEVIRIEDRIGRGYQQHWLKKSAVF